MATFLRFLIAFLIASVGDILCLTAQAILVASREELNSETIAVKNDVAFVGGKNFILKIRFLTNLNVTVEKINFSSSEEIRNICMKFSGDSDCDNTVQMLKFISEETILACGTNAKYPKCYIYHEQNGSFIETDLAARTWMPSSSGKKLVSLAHDSDKREFYVASVPSAATGGLLYKKSTNHLKTSKEWFNEPDFIGMHDLLSKSHIYLFFNEKTSVFVRNKFDGKNDIEDYYSMVARVCKSDRGGSWKKDTWMTFNKVRLICPWHAATPDQTVYLYYDEMVSAYPSGDSIFGLFRTNRNWNLPTFAIAEFDTAGIDAVIDGSVFSDNKTHYFDPKKPDVEVSFQPSTGNSPFAPGQCPDETPYELKSEFERFVLENTLVKANVLPKYGAPLFVGRTQFPFKFIFTVQFPWCKLILLMAENGYLKKILLLPDRVTEEISERRVLKVSEGIKNARLVENQNAILASTTNEIYVIPYVDCSLYTQCNSCNLDPHCAWVADNTTFDFHCTGDSSGQKSRSLRTCAAVPSDPTGMSINVTENKVIIYLPDDKFSVGMYAVITVKLQATRDVIIRTKVAYNRLTISLSDLQDGRVYEVTAAVVNGTSMSNYVMGTFVTNLTAPQLNVTKKEDGTVLLSWSRIAAASKYVINVVADQDTLLQEIVVPSTSTEHVFNFLRYQDNCNAIFFMLKASSYENVESARTQGFIQMRSIATAAVVESPNQCDGITFAVVVVAACFFITFLIIAHNIYTIKPGIRELRHDADGSLYERQYVFLWTKKHVKHDDVSAQSTDS